MREATKRAVVTPRGAALWCLALVFGFGCIGGTDAASALTRRPHVLVVVADDAGFSDFAWTGGVMPTPVLDAMKNESIELTQAYVHPVCSPTRAALFTGRLAAVTGITGPLLVGSPCQLPADLPTFGEEMRARGYRNLMAGKWHLGNSRNSSTPWARGFEDFHGVLSCCCSYYTKVFWTPQDYKCPAVDWRQGSAAVAPPPPEHSSEAFSGYLGRQVSAHVAGAREAGEAVQPLFMMLTLTAPHSPLQADPEHRARCSHVKTFRRREFCGLVVSVDEAMRRVRDALAAAGILDETLIYFTSDNGGNVWEGGRNYPYRGGKQASYEGGARTAAFMRMPPALVRDAAVLQRRVYDGLVHVSDVMPTVLRLVDDAGKEDAAAPSPRSDGDDRWARGEGYDLSDALLSASVAPPRPDVLMTFDVPTNKTGYRWGNWKLISGNPGDSRRYFEPTDDSQWIGTSLGDKFTELLMYLGHWADEDASGTLDEMVRETNELLKQVRAQIWNFVTTGVLPSMDASDPPLLFNLESDPYEDHPVQDDHPEVVEEMLARIARMSQNFRPSCNWFVADSDQRHETVEFTDPESGERKEVLYHAPWIAEGAEVDPEALYDINKIRIYSAWAIVIAEMIFYVVTLVYCARRLTRTRRAESDPRKKRQ